MFRKAYVFLDLFFPYCIVNIVLPVTVPAEWEDLISAPHGVLMETSTGTITCEKDKDIKVYLASITKIMTLVLIFVVIKPFKYGVVIGVQKGGASFFCRRRQGEIRRAD